jgi:hypothetical protein
MALGTIGTAIAASAASAAASKALSSALGPNTPSGPGGSLPLSMYAPITFTSPIEKARVGDTSVNFSPNVRQSPFITAVEGGGLRLTASNDGVSVQRQAGLQSTLDAFRSGAGAEIDALTENLARVRPGFGELTKARVGAITDARDSAVSDLRDNLARRRILGSSFANDTIGRTESQFAKDEAEARAVSFLQELEATSTLIAQRFDVRTTLAKTELQQSQFEASLAAQYAGQIESEMQASARLLAQLETTVAIENARLDQEAEIRNADFSFRADLARAEQEQTGAGLGVELARGGAGLAAQAAAGQGALFEQQFGPLTDAVGQGAGWLLGGGSQGVSAPAAGFLPFLPSRGSAPTFG